MWNDRLASLERQLANEARERAATAAALNSFLSKCAGFASSRRAMGCVAS
jgi:hypothetical protein